MGNFLYEARDEMGSFCTGVIDAASIDAAGEILQNQEKFVLKLTPVVSENQSKPKVRNTAGRGVKRSDVVMFVNQMAVMIDTGVQLTEALGSLARTTVNDRFRTVLQGVLEDVESGMSLSRALDQYPKAFPPIMISLIHASEESGTMSATLEQLAEYLATEDKIVKQVRGALLYPAFMFFVAVGVTVFLLTMILPKFEAIYGNKGAALPAPTRILLTMSNSMITQWPAWIAGTVAVFVVIPLWFRSPFGHRQLDWLKLNLPVVKTLFLRLYLARACQTIGTVLKAGLSIADAVELVRGVTPNVYFEEVWDQASEDLVQGRQLSESLYQAAIIPEPVVQMISSGEKSGQMFKVFGRLAKFSDDAFQQAVKNATQFIEPVMILVMGSVIGFVAIALLLPIFGAGKVMASG